MEKYEIVVLFEQKATLPLSSTQMNEDGIIRLLRTFEPAPRRVFVYGPGCGAGFNCKAETNFAAGVIAVDLFDRLKIHLKDGSVQATSWSIQS